MERTIAYSMIALKMLKIQVTMYLKMMVMIFSFKKETIADKELLINLSIAFNLPEAEAGALDLGKKTLQINKSFLFPFIFLLKISLDIVEDIDDDEEENDKQRHPSWHHLHD